MQIAIDGPASSGKSTIAKIIAKKLNFLYIDTGAMYRTITYEGLVKGIDLNDESSLLQILKKMKYKSKVIDGAPHYFADGKDVTEKIRTPQVAANVSKVAAYPSIREYLSKLQRQLAESNDVVMDGRDIGTIIFPDAKYKFFLTASPEVRAKRRYIENQSKGIKTNLQDLIQAIQKRDELDSKRKIAPLLPASDAVMVDTSNLDIDEVVSYMMSRIRV